MGREVTGVSEEHDPSLVKKKWNGVSLDTGHEINSKASGVSIEAKDHHMKAGTGDNSAVWRSHEKQDILAVKSTNCTDEKHDLKSTKFEDQKSSSPRKPASGPVAAGNVRIKHSVQKPLDLMSEKHAFIGPMAAETPIAGGDSSPNMNSQQSPSTTKKSQPNSAIVSRKQLDDNDNWSLASSAASVRTTRSRTTVPVAPTFRSSERLEKRKEFYAKLKGKHQALEAEKQEYAARTKEEEEAAIKQLRKTMVFKANPVPSFYYAGPPPKKELKKLPTTRAKSPKLGRRKSCSDAVNPSSEEKIACARPLRHSMGNHKEVSTPTSTPKAKDQPRERRGKGSPKVEGHSKQAELPAKEDP